MNAADDAEDSQFGNMVKGCAHCSELRSEVSRLPLVCRFGSTTEVTAGFGSSEIGQGFPRDLMGCPKGLDGISPGIGWDIPRDLDGT